MRAEKGDAVDFGAGGYESAPRITGGVLPIVGPERVYGQFTEARTPKNERIPVCVQFVAPHDGRIGLLRQEPTNDPGMAIVYSGMDLKVVRRFK